MKRFSFFGKGRGYKQKAIRLFKWVGIKLTRPRWKLIPLSFALILLLAELITILSPFYENARYDLAAAKSLVSPTAEHLRAKLRYDQKSATWLFNENAEQELAGVSGSAAKVGGAAYSAELPLNANAADGMKLTDPRNKLDISFKPEFKVGDGKLEDGYLVYPLRKNDAQLVYTFAQDGVKEDIILYSAAKDIASFSYSLSLPAGLEARLQSDGSVGIFGGDVTLFGNISYGSDKDRELVEKARENSKKTKLYYVIPAPVINGEDTKSVTAKFVLDGDKLAVEVSGLKDAQYPLSIDPSFVMDTTKCSWQTAGNNEANVNYTGCQLTRSGLSGGTAGQWNFTDNSQNRGATQNAGSGATSGMITSRNAFGAVASNGFMYAVGGGVGSGGRTALVEFASIGSNGTLGTWQATTALPEARSDAATVGYNGYIYISGGYTGGATYSTDVKYAAVCTGTNATVQFGASTTAFDAGSDCDGSSTPGSLSAWRATTSMAIERTNHAMVAYGNKMYIIDGCTRSPGQCNTGDPTAQVYCGDIGGDGTIASWSGCNTTGLLGRDGVGATVYNGYIYIAGGCTDYNLAACISQPTTLQYSKISSDGSLGNWSTTTTAFTTARQMVDLIAKDGYLYLTGGATTDYSTDVQVAKIYTNGDLGGWSATSSFNIARTSAAFAAYGDYLYVLGGCTNYSANCNTFSNAVQFSFISTTPGNIGSFVVDSDPVATNGIRQHVAVAYGGYVYALGGNNASGGGQTLTNDVRYAKINTDGSLGTWASANLSTAFANPRYEHAGFAHNGYIYVVGGQIVGGGYLNDIQKAKICDGVITTDGCASGAGNVGKLGTWGSAGGSYGTQGRDGLGVAVYAGTVYVMGGNWNTNSTVSDEISYASLNADGTVGTWSINPGGLNLGGRSNFGLAQSGKYIYLLGGRAPGSFEQTNAWRATMGPGGTIIGGWVNAGVALPENRNWSTAAVYNDYLYIIGGQTANGLSYAMRNDIKYIKINTSNGSISGSWSTASATMPSNRSSMGSVVHNGSLYVIGGCTSLNLGNCNGSSNDVSYASIYNGGGGQVTGWTNAGMTALPDARRHHGTVAYNGYLYILGGQNASNSWQTNVYYSPITSTGNGSWTSTNAYQTINNDQGVTFLAHNGYMYKIAGTAGTASVIRNDVQYAPINSDGSLGIWKYTWDNTSGASQGGGLATARWSHAAVAYNGRLYVSGGCTSQDVLNPCQSITNTVETAPINADGTVGAWSTIGTNLPSTRWAHSMVAYNSYIYLLSGCDTLVSSACGSRTTRVDYARANGTGLDSDAGCGTMWCRGSDLTIARSDFAAYGYNGYLYVLGGQDSLGNPLKEVSYAPIFNSGTVGSWTASAEFLPAGRSGFGSGATYNGRFYMIGGCTTSGNCTGGATSDVQQAGPQSTHQVTKHSMLLATDTRTLPANYFTTVTPQGVASSIDVSVSTANDPAVILNSLGINRKITSATKYQLLPGNDGTKYYWLQVALDDTQTYTWGETTSGSSMSYFQLNYHPNPGMRLRGGKTFNGNMQQSLDAR